MYSAGGVGYEKNVVLTKFKNEKNSLPFKERENYRIDFTMFKPNAISFSSTMVMLPFCSDL